MSIRATNLIAVPNGVETYLVGSVGTLIIPTSQKLKDLFISASVIGTWRIYISALNILSDGTYANSTLIFRLAANNPFKLPLNEIGIRGIAVSITPDAAGNACAFASLIP
jgi:hypothetical protein